MSHRPNILKQDSAKRTLWCVACYKPNAANCRLGNRCDAQSFALRRQDAHPSNGPACACAHGRISRTTGVLSNPRRGLQPHSHILLCLTQPTHSVRTVVAIFLNFQLFGAARAVIRSVLVRVLSLF